MSTSPVRVPMTHVVVINERTGETFTFSLVTVDYSSTPGPFIRDDQALATLATVICQNWFPEALADHDIKRVKSKSTAMRYTEKYAGLCYFHAFIVLMGVQTLCRDSYAPESVPLVHHFSLGAHFGGLALYSHGSAFAHPYSQWGYQWSPDPDPSSPFAPYFVCIGLDVSRGRAIFFHACEDGPVVVALHLTVTAYLCMLSQSSGLNMTSPRHIAASVIFDGTACNCHELRPPAPPPGPLIHGRCKHDFQLLRSTLEILEEVRVDDLCTLPADVCVLVCSFLPTLAVPYCLCAGQTCFTDPDTETALLRHPSWAGRATGPIHVATSRLKFGDVLVLL